MWVRFDDALGDDPRIAACGPAGAGLLLLALCYSNRNLTDGFVPTAILDRQSQQDASTRAAEEQLIRQQVLAKRECGGIAGYQIHADYVALQPTREQIMKQRGVRNRQKTEAGRLGGLSTAAARRQQKASTAPADTQQSVSIKAAPVPDPDPLKDKSTGADAPGSPPVKLREFDIATHAHICSAYAEVLRVDPNISAADGKETLRETLARRGLKADPADPEALRKAIDAVEKTHRVNGGLIGRRGGFEQIGQRRAAS